MTPTINDNLNKLAERLAFNMVSCSFPTGYNENTSAFGEIFTKEMTYRERSRNILVIGAGATHNLCKKIPLACEFSKLLKKNFFNKYKTELFYTDVVEPELKRLTSIYKLDEKDFETQLAAYSRFDKETVLKTLNDTYNLNYQVSLFYELVAHMFKHRFIDIIINFNFDEILDNAIEEEMNSSEYKLIYSDGHCPEKDKLTDEFIDSGRLRTPIYIKPHGTISHASTLRFTRRDYYNMPSRLKETLGFLIAGDTEEANTLPVNLVVVGFGMASFEFNSIISESMSKSKTPTLFYFDKFDIKAKSNFEENRKPKDLIPFNNENSILFPLLITDGVGKHIDLERQSSNSLNNIFFNLWVKIYSLYNKGYKPKNVDRHVIISEVFNPIADSILPTHKDYNRNIEDYLRQRLIVELSLEIYNCNDGILNLTHIQQGRVGKYYKLLKKYKEDESLFKHLRKFELKRYREGLNDTWVVNNSKESKRKVNEIVFNSLSNSVRKYTKTENISKKLKDALYEVKRKKGMFLNIVPTFIDNKISMFEEITEDNLINTDIKWIYLFKQFFYNTKKLKEWDIILSTSENGSVFSEEKIATALKGKKIVLICSYNSLESRSQKLDLIKDKLKSIEESFLNDEYGPLIRFLSYRNHNQHITLFCKVRDNKLFPIYGIYYQRRLMTKKVSPIEITGTNDLNMMKSIFFTYFERASKEQSRMLFDEKIFSFKNKYKSNEVRDIKVFEEFLNIPFTEQKAEDYVIKNYLENK